MSEIFILRIFAGSAAISVSLSQWMLLTTFFVSLFLGFAKRRGEQIQESTGNSRAVLRLYSVNFLDNLILSSIVLTIVSYSLYVIDVRTVEKFGTEYLVYTLPLVVYGAFRYLYLVKVKNMGSDPVELLISDRPLLLTIVSYGVALITILLLAN